ncbi:RNP-1 like RNA-binding protein [Phlyctochytrium arcticum]|nr:RNP-1 like RNA-binding protein [Phlyctochytrium arcticum]
MSTKRIFVGNLPWTAGTDELSSMFAEFGEVKAARIMTDRDTGRSRGFGFIDMEDDAALKAIESLDGKEFKGRELRVNEAQPAVERPRRDFGGDRGGDRGGERRNFSRDRAPRDGDRF